MIELLQSRFRVNEARLTVAGKCGQPKTEGVQVVEGVGLLHLRRPRQPSVLDFPLWRFG